MCCELCVPKNWEVMERKMEQVCYNGFVMRSWMFKHKWDESETRCTSTLEICKRKRGCINTTGNVYEGWMESLEWGSKKKSWGVVRLSLTREMTKDCDKWWNLLLLILKFGTYSIGLIYNCRNSWHFFLLSDFHISAQMILFT